jgi:ankyrin repeat protein
MEGYPIIEDDIDNNAMQIIEQFGYLNKHTCNGSLESLKFFIDRGANLNYQDNYGISLLMYAACYGHLDILQFLVEKGADTNLLDKYGLTAIHHAAIHNQLEVIKYFHDKIVYYPNEIYFLANIRKNTEIIEWLEQNTIITKKINMNKNKNILTKKYSPKKYIRNFIFKFIEFISYLQNIK